MKRTILFVSCLLASVALLACQQMQPQPAPGANTNAASSEPVKKTAPTDYEALSNRLVTQSAGVKEGDIVLISGGVRDFELLEDLVTDVRKAGAYALLTVDSDRMAQKYYEEVPEKYDSQPPELGMKLGTMATVTIGVDSNESEGVLAGVPPARLAATGKAGEPVAELFLKRNVRSVTLGNNLYPTAYRAKRFGITQEELAKAFWDSVNADYASVQATGEKVKAAVSSGKEVHITNPNGTDLKVRIEGRPFFVSDGIISPEDVKKGGAAVSVYLPAGEVYCAPVPGTAEGKVVESQTFFNGKEVTNLTLTFAAGKLTAMSGSGPGFAELKAEYDARGDGKELFAFVDFGINPNLKLWPATKLGNWVQSGMVTVGLGGNTWAGGDNKVSYGLTNYLPGSTVTLDGKTIVENGVLMLVKEG